jgi:hypothetical protein
LRHIIVSICLCVLFVASFFSSSHCQQSDSCSFQTPWGPETARVHIFLLPDSATSEDSVVVVFIYSHDDCIPLTRIDSTRLEGDTFSIYTYWVWLGKCPPCPAQYGGARSFHLGILDMGNLTVEVYLNFYNCSTGDSYQDSCQTTFTLQTIPTLTEWGLIVFALLLMTSVFIYLRKVRKSRKAFNAPY